MQFDFLSAKETDYFSFSNLAVVDECLIFSRNVNAWTFWRIFVFAKSRQYYEMILLPWLPVLRRVQNTAIRTQMNCVKSIRLLLV